VTSGRPVALRARDVGFQFAAARRPALRDVSFDLAPGECLLVVGPSGSGKSTFARAIAGSLQHDVPGVLTGELVADGGAAATGIVFQDPASQLVMERVEDDVAFGLESRAWPLDAMRQRVPETLDETGLGGFERRRTNRLSGGEQQRVALAGVLAPHPGLLVLDEPTSNLDPAGAAALFERLTILRARREATIVLVEHRVDDAWQLADQVLALGADGAPIDLGGPDEVLGRSAARLRAAGIWLPSHIEQALHGGADARPAGAAPSQAAVPGPVLAEARDLTFGYERGRRVIAGVDLQLRAGERVAIVGANGSGKSTLGRLLAGLLRPGSGSVRIRGFEPARVSSRRLTSLAGHAPQDPELAFLGETVADEVAIGLDAVARMAVAPLMDRLGLPLDTFGDRSPYRLSGGEQRRLSLAPALLRGPDLLVLDEPTFGLDRTGHEGLVAILTELGDRGACLVAATHDERFVRDAVERRIGLAAGRIVGDERPAGAPGAA